MSKWALEIEYTFQKDKTDKKQTSWFYFWSDAVKYETAVSHAEKHFKSLLTNSGWVRYTNLVAIRPIKNATNEKPVTVTVDPDPPAKPKPRRSSGPNTRTTTKTNSGAKQNAPSPSKPKTDRKSAKPTKPTTTSATSRGRGGKGKAK